MDCSVEGLASNDNIIPQGLLCMDDRESSAIAGAEDNRSKHASEHFESATDTHGESPTTEQKYRHSATPHSSPNQIDSSTFKHTEDASTEEDFPEVLLEPLANRAAGSLAENSEASSYGMEQPEFCNVERSKVRLDGYVYDEKGLAIGTIFRGLSWLVEGHNLDSSGKILDADRRISGRLDFFPAIRENFYVDRINHVWILGENGQLLGKLVEKTVRDFTCRAVIGSNGKIWDYEGDDVSYAGRINMYRYRYLTLQERHLMSFLKGLQLSEDGTVYDRRGTAVAHLICGDIEMYVGREIDEEGELGEKPEGRFWDVDGRVAPLLAAEENLKFCSMKGFSVQLDGRVRDRGGKVVARLTDGEVPHSKYCTVFDRGEV